VADPSGGFDVVINHDYQQTLSNGTFSITVKDKFSPGNSKGTGKVTHHAQVTASANITVSSFTLSPWTFSDNGVRLSESAGSSDHTQLSFGSSSGGSDFSGMGDSTINGTGGGTVNVHLDMSGLTIIKGSLTVTVTIGGESSSVTVTSSRDLQQDLAPFTLAGGSQDVQVQFQWSTGAQYVYNGTTSDNVQFS
jgi:hypothetical protein